MQKRTAILKEELYMEKSSDSKRISGRAGLPGEVKIEDYPKCDFTNSDLDDSMTNIDKIKNSQVSKTKKYPSYQK